MATYKDQILNTTGVWTYWRLNETSGTTAYDLVGGANGTVVGASMNWGKPTVFDGASYLFDGVNDYVTFGNICRAVNREPYTIETWVWCDYDSGFPTIISKQNYSSGGGYEFYIDSANNRWVFNRRASNGTVHYCYAPNNSVTYLQWQHLVCRYNGTQMSIWKNGIMVGSLTSTINQGDNSNSFTLGRYAGGSDYFLGHLSEVAMYWNALSAETIKVHYHRGLSMRQEHAYAYII